MRIYFENLSKAFKICPFTVIHRIISESCASFCAYALVICYHGPIPVRGRWIAVEISGALTKVLSRQCREKYFRNASAALAFAVLVVVTSPSKCSESMLPNQEKVQVGIDQEKAQSEKRFPLQKPRWGKN